MIEKTASSKTASSGAAWQRELVLLGLAAVVGLLVGKLLLRGPDTPVVPDQVTALPTPVADPVIGPAESAPPAASAARVRGIGKTGTPPAGAAVFPDGTWLEPLNGVEQAPPFPDFAKGAFKPVMRIDTNAATGLQWYIHEDDLVSTTQMVTHEAGDQKWVVAEWVFGQPAPTQPVR